MPAKNKRPTTKAKPKAKAAAKKPAAKKSSSAAKAKGKSIVKVKSKSVAKAAKPAATPRVRTAAKSSAAKPSVIVRDASVDAFMRGFAHPHKEQIERVRALILGLRSDVREGVKWNAPSFLTKDFFATFNFMGMDAFRLVLHTGAVPKPAAQAGFKINDPAGLLRWQGKDRALIGFRDAADVETKLPALEAVLRQWIAVADTF